MHQPNLQRFIAMALLGALIVPPYYPAAAEDSARASDDKPTAETPGDEVALNEETESEETDSDVSGDAPDFEEDPEKGETADTESETVTETSTTAENEEEADTAASTETTGTDSGDVSTTESLDENAPAANATSTETNASSSLATSTSENTASTSNAADLGEGDSATSSASTTTSDTTDPISASTTTAVRAPATSTREVSTSTNPTSSEATYRSSTGGTSESISLGDGVLATSGEEATTSPATASTTSQLVSSSTSTATTTRSPATSTSSAPSATTSELAATTTDNADTAADTGIPPRASSTISTGDGMATLNLLNLLNSTFVNSEGALMFLDFYGDPGGTLDLRTALSTQEQCTLSACSGFATDVRIEHEGTIKNFIMLSANTGNNLLVSPEDGSIVTGDAYANANVINVANTSIIDSTYLLAALNVFSDLSSDIVFPGLVSFLRSDARGTATSTIENEAMIENNIALAATTGNNTTTAAVGDTMTGSAAAGATIFNQINTTLAGGDSVSLLFRVTGDWDGEVFGLPEYASWRRTAAGFYELTIIPPASDDERPVSGATKLSASSTARIENDIEVRASTGDNAVHASGTALIATGNAYAGVNLINVANTTVVGRNWMLGIVNIFGNFTGDIAFGRPDLWVGGVVSMPMKVKSGDRVTYTHTIANNGDAEATDVIVVDTVDPHIAPSDIASGGVFDSTARTITWEFDQLAPGAVTEVSYAAEVEEADEGTAITNHISARQRETDDDYLDNEEVVSFSTYRRSGGTSWAGPPVDISLSERTHAEVSATTSDLTSLEVTRSPAAKVLTSRRTNVEQSLTLYNDSNAVIDAVTLRDTLRLRDGTIIQEEVWNLGDVRPREEIVLTYTLEFSPSAPTSIYQFDTVVSNAAKNRTFQNSGFLAFVNTLAPEPVPELASGEPTSRFVAKETATTSSFVTRSTPEPSTPPQLVATAYAADAAAPVTWGGLGNGWPYGLGLILLLAFYGLWCRRWYR